MANKIPVAGTKPDVHIESANGLIVSGRERPDWRKRVRELVLPIKFDRYGTHFFDAGNKMVAQVRGWGGLTSSGVPDSEAADIQTQWGVAIETAVNEHQALKDQLQAANAVIEHLARTDNNTDKGTQSYQMAHEYLKTYGGDEDAKQ